MYVITEEQKYRAYTFNIAGFALMTPAGKVVLDFANIIKDLGYIGFFAYVLTSLLLFILGLTFIELGRSILNTRRF